MHLLIYYCLHLIQMLCYIYILICSVGCALSLFSTLLYLRFMTQFCSCFRFSFPTPTHTGRWARVGWGWQGGEGCHCLPRLHLPLWHKQILTYICANTQTCREPESHRLYCIVWQWPHVCNYWHVTDRQDISERRSTWMRKHGCEYICIFENKYCFCPCLSCHYNHYLNVINLRLYLKWLLFKEELRSDQVFFNNLDILYPWK